MHKLLEKYGFSEAEIQDFFANAQTVSYRKRDLLLKENQINRYLYMVKKGIVRAYITDNEGKQYTKSFHYGTKNDLAVSYRSFTLQEPSTINLETVTDCEVLAWHYSYIHEKLENDIRFIRFFKHCTDTLYFRFEKETHTCCAQRPKNVISYSEMKTLIG